MNVFPNSLRLLEVGIVLLDTDTSAVKRIIAWQYNSDTLKRSLQVQAFAWESGDRSEALRSQGLLVGTFWRWRSLR